MGERLKAYVGSCYTHSITSLLFICAPGYAGGGDMEELLPRTSMGKPKKEVMRELAKHGEKRVL